MSRLVSVIIVNYNSGTYAVECIHSLLAQQEVALEVIVVDNASKDDSVAILRSACGDKINLIESEENLGFGRANNLAASVAHGKWLLFINPDARLLTNDAIATLIAYLETNTQVGIVGPEIQEPTKNKYVLPRKKYPSEHRLKYTSKLTALPGKYAWILGACLLVSKSIFQQIGGFDPDFFLYGEDADLCLRIRQAGYQVGYCDGAKITHIGGTSEQGATTVDKYLRKKRGFYLFCKKHYDARDVAHIARMSLATVYLGFAKISLWNLLGIGTRQERLQKKQRLEASKIVAKEVLAS